MKPDAMTKFKADMIAAELRQALKPLIGQSVTHTLKKWATELTCGKLKEMRADRKLN